MSTILLRRILAVCAALLLLLFVLPLFAGVLNIGNLTGIVLSGIALLVLCRYPQIHSFFLKTRPRRILRIGILVLLLLVFLLALTESCLMIRSCFQTPQQDATVVVLGCQNGSRMMHARVQAAAKYLEAHPDTVCILSGGAGSDEAVPESRYMASELIRSGVDASRLYTEERSTSTRENLMFSLELAEDLDLNTDFAIVTDGLHEFRAGICAKKLGIRCGAVPANTPWWLFPTFYVRELYGILYELFL